MLHIICYRFSSSLHHSYLMSASFLHHVCIILIRCLHPSFTTSAPLLRHVCMHCITILYYACTPYSPWLHCSMFISHNFTTSYIKPAPVQCAPLSHHVCTALTPCLRHSNPIPAPSSRHYFLTSAHSDHLVYCILYYVFLFVLLCRSILTLYCTYSALEH